MLFDFANLCFILAIIPIILGSILAYKKRKRRILILAYIIASFLVFVGLTAISFY